MNILDKQNKIKELCNIVAPELYIEFDMSKRAKNRLGCHFRNNGKTWLRFYRVLFKYRIESCLECAFHELAHYIQYKIYKYTAHNKQFDDIRIGLISEYAQRIGFLFQDIINGDRSKSIRYANYILDENYKESIINKPKRAKHKWIEL